MTRNFLNLLYGEGQSCLRSIVRDSIIAICDHARTNKNTNQHSCLYSCLRPVSLHMGFAGLSCVRTCIQTAHWYCKLTNHGKGARRRKAILARCGKGLRATRVTW